MIFVSSPYTHHDPAVQQGRFETVKAYTAKLLSQRLVAFSPIVYCHPLAIAHSLPGDAQFWKAFNWEMVNHSNAMHVLCLEGWNESSGVKMEMEWADSLSIPISYIPT